MSKYHHVKLDEEYIVRDLPIHPFKKKFRVAPVKLKSKILEKLDKEENIGYLRYINKRIHFFVEHESLIYIEDDDLADYLQKNLHLKNTIDF